MVTKLRICGVRVRVICAERDDELGKMSPRRAALYSGGTRRAREAPVDSHSTTRDASHVDDASAGDRRSTGQWLVTEARRVGQSSRGEGRGRVAHAGGLLTHTAYARCERFKRRRHWIDAHRIGSDCEAACWVTGLAHVSRRVPCVSGMVSPLPPSSPLTGISSPAPLCACDLSLHGAPYRVQPNCSLGGSSAAAIEHLLGLREPRRRLLSVAIIGALLQTSSLFNDSVYYANCARRPTCLRADRSGRERSLGRDGIYNAIPP